jgi:hypothetical protein
MASPDTAHPGCRARASSLRLAPQRARARTVLRHERGARERRVDRSRASSARRRERTRSRWRKRRRRRARGAALATSGCASSSSPRIAATWPTSRGRWGRRGCSCIAGASVSGSRSMVAATRSSRISITTFSCRRSDRRAVRRALVFNASRVARGIARRSALIPRTRHLVTTAVERKRKIE